MRRFVKEEGGMSLITVLGVLVFLLLILGTVIQLAPTHLRRAKFESDYAMALYAAESGINHALAALEANVMDDPDDENKLAGWKASNGGKTFTFENDVNSISGHYSVLVDKGLHIVSTGTYSGRVRRIQVPAPIEEVSGTGRLFPRAITATNPNYKGKGVEYDPDYELITVTVPAWEGKQLPKCDIKDGNAIEDQLCEYPSFNFPEKKNSDIVVRNSTVYIRGNVDIMREFTFDNSTFYIDGKMEVNSKGNNRLLGSNTFYIQEGLEFKGNTTITGEASKFQDRSKVPWNYFFVRRKLNFGGTPTIGSVNPGGEAGAIPDVLFFTDTMTSIKIETETGGNMQCACGIYSASRRMTFNGQPSRIYGAIVGYDFEFNGGNGPEHVQYDQSRMRNVTFKDCLAFPDWPDCRAHENTPGGPGDLERVWREI